MNSYFKPKKQGDLDSLCGVYSVINAAGSMSGGRIDYDVLFGILTGELAEKSRLEGTMEPNGGIRFRLLGELVDVASRFLQRQHGFGIRRRVASKSEPRSLGAFWNSISRHVEEHGPGSAILGLGGTHSHWTCVSDVSDRRIGLIDSGDLKIILRDRSTVGSMRGKRHHELWETQTYFLQLA